MLKHIKPYQIFESKKDDASGIWYHGDREPNVNFETKKMDSEGFVYDQNASGPGIYFSREEWQAAGYGDYIYKVNLDLDPKRVLLAKTRATKPMLMKFVDLAPDAEIRDNGLYNYSENLRDAKRKIVDAYYESETNVLECVTGIYHDLYGRNSRAYGAAMVALGYDAYFKHFDEIDNLVLWNTKLINILSISKKRDKYE